MPSKPIVLRQHIRGVDSSPETILSLSLDEQEISYTIISDQEQIKIVEGDAQESASEGAAKIHTRNGFVCVEALKPIVRVQSLPSGFDGMSANGVMPLQISDVRRQVYYQLHPGETLFVDSFTFSIVPEAYRNIPVSPSGYDGFREHVSQQITQFRSPSLKPFSTPVHRHTRSGFSSPVQSGSVTKHTAGKNHNPKWSSEAAKTDLLDIIRGLPYKTGSPNKGGGNPLTNEDPFSGTNEATPTTNTGNIKESPDPSTNDEFDNAFGDEQTNEQPSSEPRKRLNPMETYADAPATASSKRRRSRLTPWSRNLPGEEIQDSVETNVIVQEDNRNERPSSPEATEIAVRDKEESQRFVENSSQVCIAKENSEVEEEPVIEEKSEPLQSSGAGHKILFASSTTITNSRPLMRFLDKQGVGRVSDVTSCTALCVSRSSELKKTGKLIMAVLQGKLVITDDWIFQSADAGKLLEIEKFHARDPAREAEWGIDLEEAIRQSKNAPPKPFDGWVVIFTSAAKKDAGREAFHELKEIVSHGGAKSCLTTLPRKPQKESQPTLVIACHNDPASATLNGPWRCFSRDIIGLSSLRGKLDVESDEFLVRSDGKQSRGKGRKKPKS